MRNQRISMIREQCLLPRRMVTPIFIDISINSGYMYMYCYAGDGVLEEVEGSGDMNMNFTRVSQI
jgi:hypothetical protein